MSRDRELGALRQAEIGHRTITSGCFLCQNVISYYDYETVCEMKNAKVAHDFGFFVDNHPQDLAPQIERLRDILDTLV